MGSKRRLLPWIQEVLGNLDFETALDPFSYRKQAVVAFERLFQRFRKPKIVLSYSSNGYPDLDQLLGMLEKTRNSGVRVFRCDHTYHFGVHDRVRRAAVEEYLIVGE